MKKKFKIVYWAVMGLNAVVCIVDIAMARYFGAALSGLSLIWLSVCYLLVNIICQQETLIDDLLEQLKKGATLLNESVAREKLHHQEFAKMRERAQNAEIKLQQMMDDTPARGKDGRYGKR